MSTAEVSGSRLREIIEANLTAMFSADIFQQSGGWFDGYVGIDLTVNLFQVGISNTAIVDDNTTGLWPQGDYYQPLYGVQ